ncbi:phage integrase family domain protein [Mycobacterium sp. MAC_080597_8934]|nr:phage integrase family domain protein [Mycobacterium sp. MAC_080597_8934]
MRALMGHVSPEDHGPLRAFVDRAARRRIRCCSCDVGRSPAVTTVLVGQPVGADEGGGGLSRPRRHPGFERAGGTATGFGSLATSPHATATCTPG